MPRMRLTRRDPSSTPLPYTASPLLLLCRDILLFVKYAWTLPGILLPLRLGRTTPLDELYPSWRSLVSFSAQVFLTISQVLFLISIPFTIILLLPAVWIFAYIFAGIAINFAICMLVLNGPERVLVSRVPVPSRPEHEHERWFFINGVANSKFWLQNNIDQLSYSFGRKITAIHNRTAGLVFDLIECLIQRGFAYATGDVRRAYVLLKQELLNPDCHKVVIILHSQGGIEGSLVIDWLLDELPQDLLTKLEVYTFGNAANHFNNPRQSSFCQPVTRSIRHIEHYANYGDAVSHLGVLHFTYVPNRYLGSLFIRPGTGHMMNQHYLDTMFTLGSDLRVLESNPFMDMEVDVKRVDLSVEHDGHRDMTLLPVPDREVRSLGLDQGQNKSPQILRVKDFSRLWQYRNGGSPDVIHRQ
ncbi:hypothetical protein N7532_007063 [Penicillium argentinense]|uniref:Uncharacterized protein n=1 Tax=Penicillium argentinense TaxID=1131581 RepID=A0A9W9FH30_9EURO|nr:uncharacterized protein N7532_007063 [Penicillium argentinense]KAJ5100062.1 hypothetical protein N7532_007063 [Penicillium argentinense]